MQFKTLTGNSALTAILALSSACYEPPMGSQESAVIGTYAELVQRKRDWLHNYDNHCNVCFDAFVLCEKGSADTADTANCRAALNACVRGGLITDGDAGTQIADAGSVEGEVDSGAAPVADADAGVVLVADGGDLLDANDVVGATSDAGQGRASDAGATERRRRGSDGGFVLDAGGFQVADSGTTTGFDAGRVIGIDPGAAPNSADADASAPGRPSPVGQNPLAQSVEVCLAGAGTCLQTTATVRACVDALRNCVRTALEQTFDNVCTTQVAACRAEHAPAAATESVERLCQQDLGLDAEAGR